MFTLNAKGVPIVLFGARISNSQHHISFSSKFGLRFLKEKRSQLSENFCAICLDICLKVY